MKRLIEWSEYKKRGINRLNIQRCSENCERVVFVDKCMKMCNYHGVPIGEIIIRVAWVVIVYHHCLVLYLFLTYQIFLLLGKYSENRFCLPWYIKYLYSASLLSLPFESDVSLCLIILTINTCSFFLISIQVSTWNAQDLSYP